MLCKLKPPPSETLQCHTCITPWHLPCLPTPPASFVNWDCPDCSSSISDFHAPAPSAGADLVSAIRAIDSDASLTDQQKAKKKQELVGGPSKPPSSGEKPPAAGGILDIFDGSINCSFCMQLPDRPVTVRFNPFLLSFQLKRLILILILIFRCVFRLLAATISA